jgi:hypothetical protein
LREVVKEDATQRRTVLDANSQFHGMLDSGIRPTSERLDQLASVTESEKPRKQLEDELTATRRRLDEAVMLLGRKASKLSPPSSPALRRPSDSPEPEPTLDRVLAPACDRTVDDVSLHLKPDTHHRSRLSPMQMICYERERGCQVPGGRLRIELWTQRAGPLILLVALPSCLATLPHALRSSLRIRLGEERVRLLGSDLTPQQLAWFRDRSGDWRSTCRLLVSVPPILG